MLAFLLVTFTAAHSQSHKSAFEDFMKKFEKTYKTAEEQAARFAIFVENSAYVERVNMEKEQTAALALNEFADLTWGEFRSTHIAKPSLEKQWEGLPHLGTHSYSGAELPTEVDWTEKGAVTPVKNQGACGTVAFSVTGALEGAWQIAQGKLVSLSEQQFVDCDTGENGCDGGMMDHGFAYAKENALCTEESYPYASGKSDKASDGCKASKCTVGIPKGSVTGFVDVKQNDEQALMEAVSKGPVTAAIECDKQAFQFYTSGVLKATCGTLVDHGVLVVGYGEEDGVKFWKVKNSWGAPWGDKGYVKLQRENSPDGEAGECGLLKEASYPVVKSKEAELIV
jgi:KDEL-tailed cysteine endopeptidase